MAGPTWGQSWGLGNGARAWGDSWGFDVGGVVVTPTPTTTTGPGGVGSAAWRDHYRKPDRSNLPKKKKSLAEELDDMIAELREKVAENPAVDEKDYAREMRVSQALAASDLAKVSNARIQAQIDALARAIEEIDDEEVLLLALH